MNWDRYLFEIAAIALIGFLWVISRTLERMEKEQREIRSLLEKIAKRETQI